MIRWKLYKIYKKSYKKRPYRKGFKYIFFSLSKGKRVKFRPNKKFIVKVYILVRKIKLKKIDIKRKWISLKEYISIIRRYWELKGYVVKGELFYKENYDKDLIHTKTKFVWQNKVKIPFNPFLRHKIYTYEEGWKWVRTAKPFRVISIYYYFVDRRQKVVIFHRRNDLLEYGMTWKEMFNYKDMLFNEAIYQYNNMDYPPEYFSLVCWSGYPYLTRIKRGNNDKKGRNK